MAEWAGRTLGRETRPENIAEHNLNLGFPCHPKDYASTEENIDEGWRRPRRIRCPRCGSMYWVRLHTFEHPLTVVTVMEWASTHDKVLTLYPVPSQRLLRCASPLWSDLAFEDAPEDPRPFVTRAETNLFGAPISLLTAEDLAGNGYASAFNRARDAARRIDEGTWTQPGAFLVAMALPVTVNGHLAAAAGDVLIARPWWRLHTGGTAVQAFCPRLGRSVVMHHSYATVPRPGSRSGQVPRTGRQ